MCTARIDPVFIIESLLQGADGVLILACPHGECYYGEGNYIAEKRMGFLKKAIEDSNVNPKRFRLEWISATEGEKFANAVKDMVDELREIGPLHKKVAIPSATIPSIVEE
jgi:heterodisulfide reductase subunit A